MSNNESKKAYNRIFRTFLSLGDVAATDFFEQLQAQKKIEKIITRVEKNAFETGFLKGLNANLKEDIEK